MKDLAPGVQLVVARGPSTTETLSPAQLWVAVVPRDQAVDAVRAKLPEGWHVELSSDYAMRELAASLNLRFGDVREIVEPK